MTLACMLSSNTYHRGLRNGEREKPTGTDSQRSVLMPGDVASGVMALALV